MALIQTLSLAHLPPSLAVHVALYQDLNNASFLQQQLLLGNSEFEYAFIDASVVRLNELTVPSTAVILPGLQILSPSHLLAAVFRAANDSDSGRLKSRNVHSEIVFALSPNNNVSVKALFEAFGIGSSCAASDSEYLDVSWNTQLDLGCLWVANFILDD